MRIREFFWGWRHKVGCVTLVLACVLMAGWLRSLSEVDMLFCQSDVQTLHVIYSSPTGIGWTALEDKRAAPKARIPIGSLSLETFHAANAMNTIYPFNWDRTDRESQWSGVYAGTYWLESGPAGNVITEEVRTWIAQYRSLVIPLALLSALLVLRRRRPAEKIAIESSSQSSVTPGNAG